MPPVIDIHGHTVPRRGFLRPNGETAPTPAELVGIMDRLGIDQMVILPLASPEALHFVQSNEDALAACEQYPSRFIPFCCIDPRIENNSPSHDFSRILEYYRSLGCRGMGELVANIRWDDPRVQRLLEDCETAGLPVTFHLATRELNTYGLITEPELGGLERALQRFPRLQLLGHSGAFWAEVSGPAADGKAPSQGEVLPNGRVPFLFRTYPNLWGDLSAGSGYGAVSRDPAWGYRFLEEFQDRLLFGLDICMPSQEESRGRMVHFMREGLERGRISRAAYDKIMGGNAVRLLRLDG